MKEDLISHGGCNLKIYNKKRGYTLIEIVAVMGMSAIVMVIGSTLIVSSYKNYVIVKKESIRADEVDNGLLSIDRLLTNYMIKEITPSVREKKIEINYLEQHGTTFSKLKIIKWKDDNLIVETRSGGTESSLLNSMPILRDVKGFNIIKKENIYYYKITLKTGEEIINCI